MGILTEQMTRLANEIVGLRHGRQALERTLTHEGQVRETAVRELCKGFHQARKTFARRARQDRLAFLTALKRTVNDQRKALQTDLAGVRSAWEGKSA